MIFITPWLGTLTSAYLVSILQWLTTAMILYLSFLDLQVSPSIFCIPNGYNLLTRAYIQMQEAFFNGFNEADWENPWATLASVTSLTQPRLFLLSQAPVKMQRFHRWTTGCTLLENPKFTSVCVIRRFLKILISLKKSFV